MNVVRYPREFSYSCISLVGFNFYNLTYGLKPQVSGIKIFTDLQTIHFLVERLIATLIAKGHDTLSVPRDVAVFFRLVSAL